MVGVSVGGFAAKLVAQYAIRSPVIISVKEGEVDGHSFHSP
jgi:hypothetical protein